MINQLDVIEQKVPCVLCGCSKKNRLFEATDYISQDTFRLLQCQACGLVETAPRPNSAKMVRYYYPDEYFGLSGRRFLRTGERMIQLTRVWRAQAIHRLFRVPGRILDIGCGRGWMLSKLKQSRWECYGTEWSETLVEQHRQNGLHVFHAPDLRDCHFPDQFFDAVTLWHVFEHISNPSEILVEINRIMKPNGVIVIATPNFDGLVSRLSRESWFALDVPRHIYHYSHETLPAMVELTGFRVFRRRSLSIEQDIFGAAQSSLNKMGFSYNRLYNSIRNNTAQTNMPLRSETLVQKVFFWFSALTLLSLSIPAVLVLSLLKTGGTIEIWARKSADDLSQANRAQDTEAAQC